MDVVDPPQERNIRAEQIRLPTANMDQRKAKSKDVQHLIEVIDGGAEKEESDIDNHIDQIEESGEDVPMAANAEEANIVANNLTEIGETITDSTIGNTGEGQEPHSVLRPHLNHQNLAPYVCNICKNYVRGGVITICGHLFCWTCLWPVLENLVHPNCPRCLRRLNMHEDILPFHGEGPYAAATDSNAFAQPGDVPRPSGFYINHYGWEWFSVNEYERVVMNTIIESETERNLYNVLRKVPINHPIIGSCIKFLNRIQYIIIILMFILWGMFSLH